MSAGSVSTPSRTTTTTLAPARASKPSTSKPGTSKPSSTTPPTRDPDNRVRAAGQLPSIRNAAAIAQAVTGEADITGAAAAEAIMKAMHGNRTSTSSRTTLEIRRTGTHVGSRDARQAALEAEHADLAKIDAKRHDGADQHELDRQMQRIGADLRASRGMNAVADTLHVLGADDYHAGVLEDETRVRVVADDQLSGSAGYDHETHAILVSQSLADQAAQAAAQLYRPGIFDSRGRIVQGREDDLDASVYGDQLIKIGTLISYHEQKHAEQDFIGGLGQFTTGAAPAVADLTGKYDAIADQAYSEGLGVELPAWETTDDAWAIETLRVHGEEYDAYLAQEQADIALGASVQVQLVGHGSG